MTIPVFLKIMGLALLEPVLDLNLYYIGANLTSAGFATALLNIVPAVTFVMAALLRMERVKIRELRSQAKILGTVCTMAGAILMTLYHGPVVQFPWTKGQHHHAADAAKNGGNWLKGTLSVVASCFCCSSFFILHSNTLKSYPAELSLTALICLMGSMMSGAAALVMERNNPSAWLIGFDTRLFMAVYSDIICSAVGYSVQGLVSKKRGPVFVTAFNPLCMIVTAVMGSIILKEEITTGSVIGAVVIVIGLYSLIWGKGEPVTGAT